MLVEPSAVKSDQQTGNCNQSIKSINSIIRSEAGRGVKKDASSNKVRNSSLLSTARSNVEILRVDHSLILAI
jgi:hypothetical protein